MFLRCCTPGFALVLCVSPQFPIRLFRYRGLHVKSGRCRSTPKNLVLEVAARDFGAMRAAAEKLVDMIVRAIARQVLEQAEVAARAARPSAPSQKTRASRTAPSGKPITSGDPQSP
jgi:hypothetical protein